MGRPSDWWVLDLEGDPTPGDPVRVRELAGRFSELSADAFVAAGEVRRQSGEGGVTGWLGEAGAVFTESIGEFPGQLDKLETSYGMVGRALSAYAGELESAQSQADAALVRGREARGRLDTAQGQVAGVESEEESARSVLSAASGVWPLTEVPASWSTVPPPGVDPSQVRTHTDASVRLSGLRAQVSDAQGDVDAERALAVAARTLREAAASTCKGEIDRASDAGIQNRSFWDRARDFVSDAWDVLVKLAEVVIVVAAIAALVLGGPVLWTLVVVAAAVVLADKLMAYANGEASLWDVGFALLNFVPGGKALTLTAGLARGASRLRSLGGLVRGGWGSVRNVVGLCARGGARGGARPMATRVCRDDPVDVVSGQVMLTQTDVELPGLLPLVLERTHLSTYRHGRHFGPNWASTLDQRLEVDGEGVCLPLADGTILTYPALPANGGAV
nr:DUF6531 domain-containing protein [Micromonospora sp. DSM 115978]